MADIVSRNKRKEMMAGIRAKNTQPELVIRSGLHKLGFRFKIHDKSLPGNPDLKLTKFNAVIFVNGCFWHKHNCHLFKMPSTRRDFWDAKLGKNAQNDRKNEQILLKTGWRVGIVWECSLKGKSKLSVNDVLNSCSEWLKSNDRFLEIRGREI